MGRGGIVALPMSLLDLYDLSLRGRSDAPALDVDEPAGATRTLTFGELEARSNRVAHVLAARGVGAGDRLAFCLPNRLAVVDLWLAAMKLGAIVVPINVLYRGREIGHILGDAAPSAVVTTSDRVADFGALAWDVDDLDADAAQASPRQAGHARRRRRASRPGLHLGHDRRRQGRGAHARQLRGQRAVAG